MSTPTTTKCDSDLACQRQYCDLMQCLKLHQDNNNDPSKCQKQIDNLQNCCDDPRRSVNSKICEFLKDNQNQCQYRHLNDEEENTKKTMKQ